LAEASLSSQPEVDECVLQQILAFKQSTSLSNQDILEFHVRHLQIMEFYRRLPGAENDQRKGWLSQAADCSRRHLRDLRNRVPDQ